MYKIIFYTTSRGDSPVDKFLDSLQIKVRAKAEKWLQLLQGQGPELPRPYSDKLKDRIRELRISHGNLEIRLLYFFWRKTKIVITHGFLKKTDKIPKQEIERAIRSMKDFISRHGG